MTKKDVKTVLDRVLTWSPERQEDVAQVLIGMEAQDKSDLHLTEKQAEEVRRRLQKSDRRTISFEETFKRFRSRRG
jgi:Ser-tRNA(Ala) deacylase AlaX